jgi:hypothetical protein
METLRDLTEEEVNLDLRRKIPDCHLKIEDLVNATYTPLPRTKESVIRNYSVANHLRDFISNEGIGIPYSSREIMPVIFTPLISVKEIYDMVGYVRAKGLRELSSMDMIDIGIFVPPKTRKGIIVKTTKPKRIIVKTNDFETIRDGLVKYDAKERFTKRKELGEKFEKELGALRADIDNISASTSSIYQEFIEWHKGKRGDIQILLNNFMVSKRPRESIKSEVSLDYETTPKLEFHRVGKSNVYIVPRRSKNE